MEKKKETAMQIVQSETPFALMSIAIEKGAAMETLKQLMDLQERWEARNAKKAFVEAMAAFKAEAPSVLRKDGEVDFTNTAGKRTNYTHATLGGIITTITPFLSKNGLSVSWKTEQGQDGVRVFCSVTHVEGHSEQTTLIGPPDNSGNKNQIQMVGSSVTYLQRYTLLALLGLATADMDDDGIGSGDRPGVSNANPKAPEKTVLHPEVLPKEGPKDAKKVTPAAKEAPKPKEAVVMPPKDTTASETPKTPSAPPEEPKEKEDPIPEPKENDPDDQSPRLTAAKVKQIIDMYGKMGINQRALELAVGIKSTGWTETDKVKILLPRYTKCVSSPKFVAEMASFNDK